MSQPQNDKREGVNTQDQLRALEKTREQFLTVTSHKLRTPLSGIIGYVSMLLEGDFGEIENPEHRTKLQEVFAAGRELSGLIDTFMHVNAIDSGSLVLHFEDHDLKDFLYQQVEALAPVAAERDISIEVTAMDEESTNYVAQIDENMQHVLLNIIDNAIRYSEEGNVQVRLSQQDDSVHIEVEDSGIGLSEQELEHMFEKFSRGEHGLKMHPNGSGLGLYIGKHIVEGHKGEIWIDSKGVGKGVVVHLVLPLQQDSHEQRLDPAAE